MSAKVQSFDAIQRVREEVLKFAYRSGDSLTEIDGEVRRVIDWIEHDRPAYWKERVRRAFDGVTEAKAVLQRCLMYPINDEQPSCREERSDLKKAEAQLEWCRQKQQRLREISRVLRHEMHEYRGRTAQFKQWIEVDAPQASADLERIADSLERYAATTGPRTSGTSTGGSGTGSSAPPATNSADEKPSEESS